MTVAARTVGGQAQRPASHPPTELKIMNALTHWNQFEELEALHNSLGNLFVRPQVQRPEVHAETPMRVAEWTPLVDISEDAKEYLIKAEWPEVNKKDVKIAMEDGTLTISGDRKYEKAETGKKYHRVERAYGSFGRSFSLPDDASPSKVTADFKDGVLKVHLAKNEKPRPQQVEVSA